RSPPRAEAGGRRQAHQQSRRSQSSMPGSSCLAWPRCLSSDGRDNPLPRALHGEPGHSLGEVSAGPATKLYADCAPTMLVCRKANLASSSSSSGSVSARLLLIADPALGVRTTALCLFIVCSVKNPQRIKLPTRSLIARCPRCRASHILLLISSITRAGELASLLPNGLAHPRRLIIPHSCHRS